MLKKYETHTTKSLNLSGTIKSGVKSGDSENELMMIEPLIKHPEIEGLYRAIDLKTKWKGWVEYEPEQKPPISKVEPSVIKDDPVDTYHQMLDEYKRKKQLVDLGIFEESKLGLSALRDKIKANFKEEYLLR